MVLVVALNPATLFMKKVSVILTTYNAQHCIDRSIGSIRNQKGLKREFDIELIVVDDCSTDGTKEILKKLHVDFFSTKENSGGPNTGRNIGLEKASGDYICIVDQDDEWHDDRLITMLPYLEKAPIVTSGYTVIDSTRSVKIERVKQDNSSYTFYNENETFKKKLTKSLNSQNTYLGSIIYKSMLKDIQFEERFGMVDFDWILRLFHQNSSIEVNKSLYTRYVLAGNLSLNEAYRLKDFDYSLMFIKQYKDLYPKEYKISHKKIHGSMARYYYLVNNMKSARSFFLKSELNFKTLIYYLTTYAGSDYLKKKFNVFG